MKSPGNLHAILVMANMETTLKLWLLKVLQPVGQSVMK
jgi:hypothetical protein